ncbi:MAG TPA: DUF1203 domain-containing protein [Caulobacter sp.]|nr:DUF1203 domain-containing protein [Caulobacter sp.]
MSFRVTGLSAELFSPLFGLPDEVLAARGVVRHTVETRPAAPCRITLDDAEVGETVLLLNYEHQDADTPYRSRHAIFVREAAGEAAVFENEMPPALARRLLSVRAFDADHMMIDAEVVEGAEAEPLIDRLLADDRCAYLHAHFARRGCFAARIDRR